MAVWISINRRNQIYPLWWSPLYMFQNMALICCWLACKLNVCPENVGYEFARSWGKARRLTSVWGRTELVSLHYSFSSVWSREVCSCSTVLPSHEVGGGECWLSLPAVIRPRGGDHSNPAARVTALLSQELHEARTCFCHLFSWKLLGTSC